MQYEPAGQAVAEADPVGQYAPGVHMPAAAVVAKGVGVVEPAGQTKPPPQELAALAAPQAVHALPAAQFVQALILDEFVA